MDWGRRRPGGGFPLSGWRACFRIVMGTGRDRVKSRPVPSLDSQSRRSRDCPGVLALLVVGCRLDGKKAGGIKLLYVSYKHFFYVQYSRPSY